MNSEALNLIAELTQRDSSELDINMTLFGDLALESVELLELEFSLEQSFSLKLGEKDLWNIPEYIIEMKMFNNGKFSEDAFEHIKNIVSQITPEILGKMSSPHEVLDYLSIADIDNFIQKAH